MGKALRLMGEMAPSAGPQHCSQVGKSPRRSAFFPVVDRVGRNALG
jgi:hypothetical protein